MKERYPASSKNIRSRADWILLLVSDLMPCKHPPPSILVSLAWTKQRCLTWVTLLSTDYLISQGHIALLSEAGMFTWIHMTQDPTQTDPGVHRKLFLSSTAKV